MSRNSASRVRSQSRHGGNGRVPLDKVILPILEQLVICDAVYFLNGGVLMVCNFEIQCFRLIY